MTLALFNDAVQYIENGLSHASAQVEDIWHGRGQYEAYWDYCSDLASKVMGVVKSILVVLVSIALMIANPGFFGVSFVIGFVFHKEVSAKLEEVWQNVREQSWVLIVAAGCGAFVSLPITVAILSSAWALYWGSSLPAQENTSQTEGV